MSSEIHLKTRREFLATTLVGGALSWTVPSFLANTFAALQAQGVRGAAEQVGILPSRDRPWQLMGVAP